MIRCQSMARPDAGSSEESSADTGPLVGRWSADGFKNTPGLGAVDVFVDRRRVPGWRLSDSC